MKKFIFLIFIFTFSKIGVTLAAPISGNSVQNFFLGNAFNKPSTYNQVLALLIGPTGKPGAAGVAGRNGFDGLNGLDGKDGIDGAPGPVGPQGLTGPQGPVGPQGLTGPQGPKGDKGEAGATGPQGPSGPSGSSGAAGESVVVTPLPIGDSYCANGGSKFQVGGVITFACNGTSGSGTSGSSGSYGNGSLELTTCDDAVTFSLDTNFNNRFFMDSVTMSGVSGKCNDLKLTMVFQINDPKVSSVSDYLAKDKIYCEKVLSGGNVASLSNTYVMSSATSCRVNKTGSVITLSNIATADIDSVIGFQIT